jgi:hypothetical protein
LTICGTSGSSLGYRRFIEAGDHIITVMCKQHLVYTINKNLVVGSTSGGLFFETQVRARASMSGVHTWR